MGILSSMASIFSTSAGKSTTSAAFAFSRIRSDLRVPGIGIIQGFLQSIHAKAICAGVACFSATDKGADARHSLHERDRNRLNVFGYLSYLMLVLPSWGKTPSEEQLDSIMPWSATLPETCHRTYHQIVENMAEVK